MGNTTIKFRLLQLLFLLICVSAVYSQQAQTVLHGQVADSMGGVLPNTIITATDKDGKNFTAVTDLGGNYKFESLPAGRYTIKVNAEGFSPFENKSVEIKKSQSQNLNIVLTVADAVAEVTVDADETVTTDPTANADSTILRNEELDALPDDGEDLMQALQMLAGPTASVDETLQVSVDGFRGGGLPPKSSIREVRINNNPFAAEYDRMGNGRVEILTKPGTNEYRGQTFFSFNDESLNSRSPFVLTRSAFQSRRYGGNFSGPIIPKKSSFFFDFEKRGIEDNREINAIILDSSLNPVPINQTIVAPTRRTNFTPRVDWQLNDKNTLIVRYIFDQSRREKEGVGNFNLESRGYESRNLQHTFQITETAVINQNSFIETRGQFSAAKRNNEGGSFEPSLRILDAFTSGGAQVDGSFNNENRLELQSFLSRLAKKHSFKMGARFRWGQVSNASEQNFAGTFTFGGGSAPQLDANNQIIRDQNNNPLTTTINSLERYRRTLYFQKLGFSPVQIRAYGGGATQFSILGGNPEIRYSQSDFSPFFQDDWRIKPNLTISYGVRYDWQNNIKSGLNFAPRFSFAWSPKAKKKENQKTVVRAGIGVFYDRFNESMLSQSLRYDGINQQQFVISSTENGQQFLDLFPNTPTIEQLSSFLIRQTLRKMDKDLETPYTIQSAVTFERQLPYKTSLSINYIDTRTNKMFRSRNINAPNSELNNARPFPDQGNIFQFESTGRFRQHQLNIGINNRFSRGFTLSANYSLTDAKSDTDGLGTFPINQYDLSTEFARSAADIRHRFTFWGSINNLPWGIRLNPSFSINSGRPFNITVGRDLNRDAIFTDRPAFADEKTTAQDLRVTPFGSFDINPKAGQNIIPRNYATGPAFASIDLRISKDFRFGVTGTKKDAKAKYNLNLSANVQNLTNSTHRAIPIGNLSSPLFGVSNFGAGRFGGNDGSQSAGNRRIDLQVRFNF